MSSNPAASTEPHHHAFFGIAIQSLGATSICVLGGALLRDAAHEIEPGWIRAAKEMGPS